jgi:hypothetical protein
MLLHFPIVIAALPFTPIADAVPKFDISRERQSEVGSQPILDRCSADEAQARQQLQAQWIYFAIADKANCTRETTMDGTGSDVELLTCLEIVRDVDQFDLNQ